MANRGREVLRGKLFHRRKGNAWKKRAVIAFCGMQSAKATPAQLLVLEDYEKVEKDKQKPKNFVKLEGAKIESSYTGANVSGSASQGSSPAYSTALAATTTTVSPSSKSPLGSSSGSTSGSGSGLVVAGAVYSFSVRLENEVHEFRMESENDRIRWVKLLGLLAMFPHSTIPEEPVENPIKPTLRLKLDPRLYHADSVWPVYILPEEVGSKLGIIGVNVVALTSGVPNQSVGRLDIVNPADPANPLVSWDQDKMRRTGKTSNLVFIEIGRRCKGGPGLVWMYAGPNEAQPLRETLHNFLFKGDGSAVAIPTQQTPTPLYDVPRASFDSSLPPSYSRQASMSAGSSGGGYTYNSYLSRSRSQDGGDPASYSSSPASVKLDGPPVRLDKHPSIRRKKQDSQPRDIKRRSSHNISPPQLDAANGGASSVDSALDDAMFEHGEETTTSSPNQSRSESPEEEDGDGCVGQMDDPKADVSSHYDIPKLHTKMHPEQTVSSYEKMVHPKFRKEGYVYMQPSSSRQESSPPRTSSSSSSQDPQRSDPIPIAMQNGVEGDFYHKLQHFPQNFTRQNSGPSSTSTSTSTSPPDSSQSVSPRSRSNYDKLPTIAEDRNTLDSGISESGMSSNYENHPLPQELACISPKVYQPNYVNVELAQRERKGSQNADVYENVTANGKQVAADPRTANENGRRRRNGDKEVVAMNGFKSPSPPLLGKNGLKYIEIDSNGAEGNGVNPTIRPVDYSTVDMQSTEGLNSIKRQRSLRGAAQRSLRGAAQQSLV